jgi:hypothetical protein
MKRSLKFIAVLSVCFVVIPAAIVFSVYRQPYIWNRWWFPLVAWPGGITTWAIILTLIAIVWQSYETRRSVAATKRSIILQFRPKLSVRRLYLRKGTWNPETGESDANPWKLSFDLVNVGYGNAHLREGKFTIALLDGSDTNRLITELTPGPLTLKPGEEREFSVPLEEQLTNALRVGGKSVFIRGEQGTDRLHFFSVLTYCDDIDTERHFSTKRRYINSNARLTAEEDPDWEYSD